jgi:protein SCO1/2
VRCGTALLVAGALALTACGDDRAELGGPDNTSIDTSPDRELTGFRREPPPVVGDLTLPAVNRGGDDFAFRADPGELLVVYFGYTNCPDFCPTTLSDLRIAMRRLEPADAARIDVAMVTVDPDRDLPILDVYITSFFDDGIALGTDDADALARVAAPFGAAYEVTTTDEGTIDVAHSTLLYVVDDAGELLLTWQFGAAIADLAADLAQLIRSQAG